MAQMDPAGTKSASSTGNLSDYASYPPAVKARVGSQPNDNGSGRLTALPKTVVSLLRALELAADHTATTIAHGTKQTRLEVRERLNEIGRAHV